VAAYIVAELDEEVADHEPVEGLTAAKFYASTRARSRGCAMVVREVDTGCEVARFTPGASSFPPPHARDSNRPSARATSRPPATADKRPSTEALVRLRAANQRLQALLESQSKGKKDSRGV
jgi:hypothetical protein